MESQTVVLSPITDGDIEEVAAFLHSQLNPRVSVADWVRAMNPTWSADPPNHGFLLSDQGRVIGAYLAFYSERVIDGHRERFCNLGAWSVDPEYRSHGLRLVRAMLGQRGLTFTDLSPSGSVVAVNERLGFKFLDTATALVPNIPRPTLGRRVRVVTDLAQIHRSLSGDDLRLFLDHRDAAAALHFVIKSGGDRCYTIARKDRRKDLPVFASILYVSNKELFARTQRALYGHLLVRHGALATLAELRVVGSQPPWSIPLTHPRPKMYRSTLGPQYIDYLYSELTSVAW
ncbi:MAG: hypothetical protein WCF36_08945 [Candidatus Nanopelagicales bacterium]